MREIISCLSAKVFLKYLQVHLPYQVTCIVSKIALSLSFCWARRHGAMLSGEKNRTNLGSVYTFQLCTLPPHSTIHMHNAAQIKLISRWSSPLCSLMVLQRNSHDPIYQCWLIVAFCMVIKKLVLTYTFPSALWTLFFGKFFFFYHVQLPLASFVDLSPLPSQDIHI